MTIRLVLGKSWLTSPLPQKRRAAMIRHASLFRQLKGQPGLPAAVEKSLFRSAPEKMAGAFYATDVADLFFRHGPPRFAALFQHPGAEHSARFGYSKYKRDKAQVAVPLARLEAIPLPSACKPQRHQRCSGIAAHRVWISKPH